MCMMKNIDYSIFDYDTKLKNQISITDNLIKKQKLDISKKAYLACVLMWIKNYITDEELLLSDDTELLLDFLARENTLDKKMIAEIRKILVLDSDNIHSLERKFNSFIEIATNEIAKQKLTINSNNESEEIINNYDTERGARTFTVTKKELYELRSEQFMMNKAQELIDKSLEINRRSKNVPEQKKKSYMDYAKTKNKNSAIIKRKFFAELKKKFITEPFKYFDLSDSWWFKFLMRIFITCTIFIAVIAGIEFLLSSMIGDSNGIGGYFKIFLGNIIEILKATGVWISSTFNSLLGGLFTSPINKVLIIISIPVNIITFVMFGIDKAIAATNGDLLYSGMIDDKDKMSRVPELSLLTLGACYGSLGMFIGMPYFRHKTEKRLFKICRWAFLILNIALLFCFR